MIEEHLLIEMGALVKCFDKGEYIFYENAKARFYYQVKSGIVKMANFSTEGKPFVQGNFKMGESFGEPPLFDESLYPASAIAEETCEVYKLSKAKFIKLLHQNPDIHFKFTSTLAIRLKYKSMLLKEISSFRPEHRIISLIDYIKKNEGIASDIRYEVKLTRQQIADYTGLRVETVIRAVKALEKEKKLMIKDRKIYR